MNWSDNGTKILGGLSTLFGTILTLITTGAFDKLLSETSIGWLGIIASLVTTTLGGTTIARGFNNTTKEKLADAFDTAIHASPGEVSQAQFLKGELK